METHFNYKLGLSLCILKDAQSET